MEWFTFAMAVGALPTVLTNLFGLRFVGLTGIIASGKSTTTTLLRSHGAPVIDFDLIARIIVYPGSPVLTKLTSAFGPSLLLPSGELDRAALGAMIFGDAPETVANRRRVSAIMRPYIAWEFFKQALLLFTCDVEAERAAAAAIAPTAAAAATASAPALSASAAQDNLVPPAAAAASAVAAAPTLAPAQMSIAERTRALDPAAPALPRSVLSPLSAATDFFFKWRLPRVMWGAPRVVVLDVPLLFEAGFHWLCGRSLCVLADDEAVLRRLMRRDSSPREAAEARIRSQWGADVKRRLATDVVDNSAPEAAGADPASPQAATQQAASAAAITEGSVGAVAPSAGAACAGAVGAGVARQAAERFPLLAAQVDAFWRAELARAAAPSARVSAALRATKAALAQRPLGPEWVRPRRDKLVLPGAVAGAKQAEPDQNSVGIAGIWLVTLLGLLKPAPLAVLLTLVAAIPLAALNALVKAGCA